MGNIVKLVFQSVAQGSGMTKISQDTAALHKNLNMASGAIRMLTQGLGDIGQLAGGALSAILAGNFWQVGAKACDFLIGKIKEHNQLMKDAALAAKGLSKEYMTLEAAHRGYTKRVEEWKRAKEAADKAEQEAAEAKKIEAEAAKDEESARLSYEQKYYDLQQKIADEIKKREAMNADEATQLKAKIGMMREAAALAVRKAEGNAAYANEHGTAYEKDTAQKELELAREQQKTAEAQAKKMKKDFEKSEKEKQDKKKKDEEDFAEFVRKQREKLDDELAKRHAEDTKKEMEDELDALRKVADKTEQTLSDARKRAADAHDILGNAGRMDQAGELRSRNQEDRMNARYEKRRDSLQKRLDAVGGDASKLGRLSNIDRATLDRMTAEKQVSGAEAELQKLNDKMDTLTQQLKEIGL